MALDGFNIVCLEPEPPEGFVDNTVYRYRIDKDGNKRSTPEVIGDQVIFLDHKKDSGPKESTPSGWDDLGTEVDAPF